MLKLYIAGKLDNGYYMLVIDETSFTNSLNYSKGWDIKGKGNIYVPMVNCFKSMSMISCISLFFGQIAFQMREGFYCNFDFLNFS